MSQQKISSLTRLSCDLAPPWSSLEMWREANHSVRHHLQRHRSGFSLFKKVFQDTENRMALIYSMLDELCENTCPWCPEPCCLSATVWFDLPDLLFLHAGGCLIPPMQPKKNSETNCHYFGPRGCRLPRSSRPWICTWYLCDSQLACLRKKDAGTQRIFKQSIKAIKTGRKKMEKEYIRIVAG